MLNVRLAVEVWPQVANLRQSGVNKGTMTTIDVKFGYPNGNIDMDQLRDYVNLIKKTNSETPTKSVIDALEAGTKSETGGQGISKIVKHEYLFVPTAKGQSAEGAAKALHDKLKSFGKKENENYFQYIDVWYVDGNGVKKLYTGK